MQQIFVLHDDEPKYCRLENLVVTIYLLVTTILNNASRNFIRCFVSNIESISTRKSGQSSIWVDKYY